MVLQSDETGTYSSSVESNSNDKEEIDHKKNQYIIITPDEGVKKKFTLECANNKKKPVVNDNVTIHYVARLKDDYIFDSSKSRGIPLVFKLGSDSVIKGLEIAVGSMTKDEKGSFIISPEYAYGSKGLDNIVPPDSTIQIDIKLIDFQVTCFEAPFSMSISEKIQNGYLLKQEGNKYFEKKDFKEAIRCYKEASLLLNSFDRQNDLPQEYKILKFSVHLNLANCYLKSQAWEKAEMEATNAIKLDSSSIKALYRRGVARLNLKDLDGSKKDLTKALSLNSHNPEIQKKLLWWKEEWQQNKKRQQIAFQDMFKNDRFKFQ